jgi:hypothetical protein
MRTLGGLALGILVSLSLVWAHGRLAAPPRPPAPLRGEHVREDGGQLDAILIQYAPETATLTRPLYAQLLRALPRTTAVHVACATATDCADLAAALAAAGVPQLDRLRPVVVGAAITTWSRDRFAAKRGPDGRLEILAPPRTPTPFEPRAGDGVVPFALGRTVGAPTRTAGFAFEGGDLASTARHLFVDVNLLARQQAFRPVDRAALLAALAAEFSQEIVMLGAHEGDVPQHHIMMYLAPVGGRRVIVGDPAWGLRLLDADAAARATVAADRTPTAAARFEHAARELASRGFEVGRAPVVVLEGGGAYVTYTNALFFDDAGRRVVALPSYGLPALDRAAQELYRSLGFEVRPVDVAAVYRHNGSLGCLVNVLARG